MKFILLLSVAMVYACVGEAALVPDGCSSCHTTTLPLTKLGQKCYYFETIAKANWFDANHFCNSYGMRLATIQNQEENVLLERYITTLALAPGPPPQYTPRLWTSGHNFSGTWYWLSTGHRFSYTRWAPGEPYNWKDSEHCVEVALYDGKLRWNDYVCDKEIPFICEI